MTISARNEYRQRAEECRRLAESTSNPLDREAWLKLAAAWLDLVAETERTPRLAGRRDGAALVAVADRPS